MSNEAVSVGLASEAVVRCSSQGLHTPVVLYAVQASQRGSEAATSCRQIHAIAQSSSWDA